MDRYHERGMSTRRIAPALAGLGVLCFYTLSYLVWRFLFASATGAVSTINNLAVLPLYLAAAGFAVLAARDSRLGARTRRAWLLIAAANLASWSGDLLWAWYDTVRGVEPFPSWADAGYVLAYPLLMSGLVTFATRPRTTAERVRFGLDAATVMLGAWMVSWYFVLGPTVVEGESDLLTRLLATAYPVGDLVILFGAITVLLRRPEPSAARALRFLLAGVVITIVADFGFGYLSLAGESVVRPWLDALWMLAPLAMAAAAVFQRNFAASDAGGVSRRVQPSDLLAFAPYAGIAIGYALLLAVGIRSSDYQLGGLLVGAMLMTAIVVGRQVIAFRENAALLRRAEGLAAELRHSEARFRALVQHSSDVVLVIDPDTTVRYISPSVLRVMGYHPETIVGGRLLELVHPDDAVLLRGFVGDALALRGVTDPAELRFRHAEGSWCHIEAIGNNLTDDPDIGGIVINARDTSDRKRLEEELAWQAYHDPLTGLPNRRLFLDRLDGALARARRSGQRVALLFIDLDEFKSVNDRFGHRGGDDVLMAVAQRLLGAVRPGDTVARLAGDEFTVLLEGLPGLDEAVAVAKRIEETLAYPASVSGTPVTISASIGIAINEPGRSTLDDLLRSADLAMYDAKRQGRARYAVFRDHDR